MSLAALALFVLPIQQTALADIARDEQKRLNACITKVEAAPLEAYEDSLAWLSSGNRPPARYCNALALLALEHYEEGAARLEALATAPDAMTLEDRTLYMAQAGNAWLTAEYPDAAVRALSEAIKLRQGDIDLLKDRASAYLLLERYIEAIDDLNAALALIPVDSEALTMRARAHLATDNLRAADLDMREALAQDPRNIDILVLRGEVREAIRISRAE
ncbi:MAG: hypothetical protein AAGF20_06290 [Pseudomonadota bacterium]